MKYEQDWAEEKEYMPKTSMSDRSQTDRQTKAGFFLSYQSPLEELTV